MSELGASKAREMELTGIGIVRKEYRTNLEQFRGAKQRRLY
jgi:hypothetical protein